MGARDYSTLRRLVEIDSPTGMTDEAVACLREVLESYGYRPEATRKGALRCPLGDEPKLALAAHVDTLGAVISKIRDEGRLRISPVGGLSLNMAEGEYVKIHRLDGGVSTGTFLLDNPSAHANKELATAARTERTMHVRIDAEVTCAGDVRALGIRPGDIVAFKPRYCETETGFIKSRFLDNKAGCFVLLEVARELRERGKQPPAELFFSTYEEVGHGGTCGYSQGVEELLVIDMGVLGDACEGTETACSICAKDSSGPYDRAMLRRLVTLAEEREIPHAVDVYPYYGSDGSAALRAGNDFRVGLIGPGVAASHGVERTHRKGVEATIELALAYLGV